MYPYSFTVNNPKQPRHRFPPEHRDESFDKVQYVLFALACQSEHDDARVVSGSIEVDVGKVQIESDEDAIFIFADGCDCRIRNSGHLLVHNARRIVPGIP